MARVSPNVVADSSVSAVVALTDSTTGTASDTLNDTTVSVKDDLASLAAKINEIVVALQAVGIIR